MSSYTPVFSGIVDSSLWMEEDYVVKVFLTMLAKKDRDHVVRASAFTIGQWSKKGEEEVLKALKILSSPDKKRIEKQPFDGRRIERVEDGWLILNGRHYQDLMRDANRRAYKAAKEREYRARRKAQEAEIGADDQEKNLQDLVKVHQSHASAHKEELDRIEEAKQKAGTKWVESKAL